MFFVCEQKHDECENKDKSKKKREKMAEK